MLGAKRIAAYNPQGRGGGGSFGGEATEEERVLAAAARPTDPDCHEGYERARDPKTAESIQLMDTIGRIR